MGKGIKLEATDVGIGVDGDEIPFLEEEVSSIDRMNELILRGKTPETAKKILDAQGMNGSQIANRLLKTRSIVEQNIRYFEKVGMKRTAPYKVLYETMMSANKTAPITVNGRVEYREFPDHAARLNAAKAITLLMGMDPRQEMKVNIQQNSNGSSLVQVQLGDTYLSIAQLAPEQALIAYNDMQRNQKNIGYKIVSDDSIEGEFTQVAGSGG